MSPSALLRALTLALSLLLLVPAASALAEIVPGQVVVKFADAPAPGARAAALDRVGAEGSSALAIPDTRVVTLDPDADVRAAAARLQASDAVVWAEPNYVVRASALPNDPGMNLLWGLRNTGQVLPQDLSGGTASQAGTAGVDVGALPAWDITTGASRVLVGVVDSGVAKHVDLNANLRTDLSRDFTVQGDGVPADPYADSDGHGTHVAGTIGAVGNNGIGVAGVDWTVGLVSLRALDPKSGTSAGIASAFAYAGQRGLPIVNASLGLPEYSRAMEDAIELAPNTLFVVAAGNESTNLDGTPSYPCSLPEANIVCVASIDNDGALSYFSNTSTTSVDLGAPGNQILSTLPTYAPDEPVAVTGAWTHGGTLDDWTFDAGAEVWSTGVQAGTDSWLQVPPVDLTGQRACTMKITWATDWPPEAAAALVERSVDGGATWQLIAAQGASTDGDPIEGVGSAKADGLANVIFRVRLLGSPTSPTLTDALQVSGFALHCLAPGDSVTYDRLSGTSMASPHVAGVAALLLAKDPDLSTAQLRRALLSTTVAMPSLTTATATGGRVDANAALASLAPTPLPVPSGGGTTTTTTPVPVAPMTSGDAAPAAPPVAAATPAPLRASLLAELGRLRSDGVLTARVGVSRTASGRVDAVLRWRGGFVRVAGVTRDGLEPGEIATMRLSLSPAALRRVRAARAAGRDLRVQVTFTATATDGQRAETTRSQTLRVARKADRT